MNLSDKAGRFIRLALAGLLTAAMLLTGCKEGSGSSASPSPAPSLSGETQNTQAPSAVSSDTAVHFIDVGQGLSVLIQSDGHFMLYDGGDRTASSLVVSYLEDQGVETLDYVIASHYDADHLNGVVGALNVYQADEVLAPDYETDTKVFQSFQSVVKEKGIPLVHPNPGDTYSLGNASFTVLAPQDREYKNANDYSVAIRLEAGDVSFLITGDAEVESEAEMAASGLPLESTVYVAGHHGSASSGSWDFLQKAVPEYAVISCGAGNSYGHPHAETMEKFESMGIEVFRTDKQGTIIASTDGHSLTWSAEPCNDYSPGDPDDEPARPSGKEPSKEGSGPAPTVSPDGEKDPGSSYGSSSKTPGESSETELRTYILNTNSQLIHMPDCKSAADMSEKNKQVWTGDSLEQCLKEHPGYRGCKSCQPY